MNSDNNNNTNNNNNNNNNAASAYSSNHHPILLLKKTAKESSVQSLQSVSSLSSSFSSPLSPNAPSFIPSVVPQVVNKAAIDRETRKKGGRSGIPISVTVTPITSNSSTNSNNNNSAFKRSNNSSNADLDNENARSYFNQNNNNNRNNNNSSHSGSKNRSNSRNNNSVINNNNRDSNNNNISKIIANNENNAKEIVNNNLDNSINTNSTTINSNNNNNNSNSNNSNNSNSNTSQIINTVVATVALPLSPFSTTPATESTPIPPTATIVSNEGEFIDSRLLDGFDNGFSVVGVIGFKQAGKTAVLASLCGLGNNGDPRTTSSTQGIQIIMASEKMILIDTEPVLNATAMADQLSKSEPFSSFDNRSLQIAMFLLSACHVVLVVQDGINDVSLLKLLALAEILKNRDDGDHREYSADLIWIHNRLSSWDLLHMKRSNINEATMLKFAQAQFNDYRFKIAKLFLIREKNEKAADQSQAVMKNDKNILLPAFQISSSILDRPYVNAIIDCSISKHFPKSLSGSDWMRNSARSWETTKSLLTGFNLR